MSGSDASVIQSHLGSWTFAEAISEGSKRNSQKIRNRARRAPDSDAFPLEVWQYMSAT